MNVTGVTFLRVLSHPLSPSYLVPSLLLSLPINEFDFKRFEEMVGTWTPGDNLFPCKVD